VLNKIYNLIYIEMCKLLNEFKLSEYMARNAKKKIINKGYGCLVK